MNWSSREISYDKSNLQARPCWAILPPRTSTEIQDNGTAEAAFDIFNAGGLDRGAAGTTELKVKKAAGEYVDDSRKLDSTYKDLYGRCQAHRRYSEE